VNLVNVVPAGVVVFFSSYGILGTVRRLWTADKTLEKIGLRKKVSLPMVSIAVLEASSRYSTSLRMQLKLILS